MRRRHNPKGSILVITGTPGSGKTTLAEALHRRLKNSNMISVNSLIREKKFFISREKDYSITKKKTLEIGRDWMKLGIACEKEVSGSGEKQNGLKERSAESAEAIRNNAGEKAKLELDGILLESITESSIAEV